MTTPTMDSVQLVRDLRADGDQPARWTAVNGRFTVVRNSASRGSPISYDITDTARTDWVDRPGQGNVVRVYETADVRALIAKAIRRTPRRGRSVG